MSARYQWGVDLGGTKIEAVILDAEDYTIIRRERMATEAANGYQHVLGNIQRLIGKMSAESGIACERLGIGTPGSINPHTQKLRNCNSVYLNGQGFRKDLEKKMAIPVRMTNDANCFAVSEYQLGIIKTKYPDAKNVFAVIMGTGVGAGLVIDGKIIEGKNSIGGEWGHNFLDDSGGNCYCGKSGCVETIISGPALEAYYKRLSAKPLKLHDIVLNYRDGNDPHAAATMERLFHFFPLAISAVINIVDPDVVVIGGGLGNINELYTEGLASLDNFVFSDYVETVFTKPQFGDSSGVLGAALLWEQ